MILIYNYLIKSIAYFAKVSLNLNNLISLFTIIPLLIVHRIAIFNFY
jgi:hypothetical protein